MSRGCFIIHAEKYCETSIIKYKSKSFIIYTFHYKSYSTDTPVCELRASGRALEASPSLRGESAVSPPNWLRALINAFIV